MKWERVNEWTIASGLFSITRHPRPETVPYPYGLWLQNINHGYFETAEAAKAAAISIVAMQA